MQKEVEDYIRSLSDIDLIEYVRNDIYLPEAIQFAKEEMARRNLTSERAAAIEKALAEDAEARGSQETVGRVRKRTGISLLVGVVSALGATYCLYMVIVAQGQVPELKRDLERHGQILSGVLERSKDRALRPPLPDRYKALWEGSDNDKALLKRTEPEWQQLIQRSQSVVRSRKQHAIFGIVLGLLAAVSLRHWW